MPEHPFYILIWLIVFLVVVVVLLKIIDVIAAMPGLNIVGLF